MPAIFRRSGSAWIWTCKTTVERGGKLVPCDVFDVVESEQVARDEYDRHKKTTKGH